VCSGQLSLLTQNESYEFIKYDFEYEDFMSLSHQYIQRYYRKAVSDEDVAKTRLLLELLFIRSGAYQLDIFSVSDVKVMIDSLCTM